MGGDAPAGRRQIGKHLQAGYDDEENIGEALKLHKQSFREEIEQSIFGSDDDIGRVVQTDVLLRLVEISKSGRRLSAGCIRERRWRDFHRSFAAWTVVKIGFQNFKFYGVWQ